LNTKASAMLAFALTEQLYSSVENKPHNSCELLALRKDKEEDVAI
jgi:hypothetical protein